MDRGGGRLRSGSGYGGGGGMSKRGGPARRGIEAGRGAGTGRRFLSLEEEERLRNNILRRNSEREEGSEMDATETLEQVLNQSGQVADRVRRLAGGGMQEEQGEQVRRSSRSRGNPRVRPS